LDDGGEPSALERLARSPEGRRALVALDAAGAERAQRDWTLIARPKQLAPDGSWRVWLLLAGRGFGKTRSGAEWVRARIEAGVARRIALVAPTAADARDVMIEGESGLYTIARPSFRPDYEPSRRRLTFPNGAIATAFSAEEPGRLRGPQHDTAWCDEIAAWRYEEAWDNLMLGLRLGSDPRCVATTTPKPVRLVRKLVSERGWVTLTHGRTWENAAHLAPAFLEAIAKRYQGTRLGRQELDAELLDDLPNAMWQRASFEREGARVTAAPELRRIVVAIDPAAGSGEDNDETGIVVAGVAWDGQGYVLEDLSGRMTPHHWAARAVAAYRAHRADRIVAEVNNGGDMVAAMLRTADPGVSFKAVHASRGKAVRAEPVASLYEQGRVHHVGTFPALEDQLCGFTGERGDPSPDRLDALVWALSELMVEPEAASGVMEFYRRQYEKVN
jgi:predicted phage terminase large subunit-like protein